MTLISLPFLDSEFFCLHLLRHRGCIKAKFIWPFKFFFFKLSAWNHKGSWLHSSLNTHILQIGMHTGFLLQGTAWLLCPGTLCSDFRLLELYSNLQDYTSKSWRLSIYRIFHQENPRHFCVQKKEEKKIIFSRLQTLLVHRTIARGKLAVCWGFDFSQDLEIWWGNII